MSAEKHLIKLSVYEIFFKESIPVYKEVLIKSGYNHQLKHQKDETKSNNTRTYKRENHFSWKILGNIFLIYSTNTFHSAINFRYYLIEGS